MVSTVNKKILIRNFSRYAYLYDRYADIQSLAARELINQIEKDGIKNILEIGCGTGNYTKLLKTKFKSARLKALDISKKMIEVAKNKLSGSKVEFVVADADNFMPKGKFDLISSNAAFQWLEDLEKAVTIYKNALSKNGLLAFSIFGPLTFQELDQCLSQSAGRQLSISSHNFFTKEKLKEILRKYFKQAAVRELIIKQSYSALLELLNKIRYTGVRGAGTNNAFFLSRKLLKQAEDIYKFKFGQVKTTYQIFLCKAF